MEHWKRKQMRLNYRWDLTGFEEEEVSGSALPPHPPSSPLLSSSPWCWSRPRLPGRPFDVAAVFLAPTWPCCRPPAWPGRRPRLTALTSSPSGRPAGGRGWEWGAEPFLREGTPDGGRLPVPTPGRSGPGGHCGGRGTGRSLAGFHAEFQLEFPGESGVTRKPVPATGGGRH